MRFLTLVFYYLLGITGIIAISTTAILFEGSGWSVVLHYIRDTFTLMGQFIQPDQWVYNYRGKELPMLEVLMDPYIYSMQILISALLLGLFVSLVLSVVTVSLPARIYSAVKRFLNFLEAIPDLMFAVLLQFAIVVIGRETGVYVIQYVAYQEQLYTAPVLVLSILPMLMMYKILVLLIEEELTKDYVALARSKGIKHRAVVLLHVLRNIVVSAFFHTKIIVWTSLSSLLIIERFFNIHGVTDFLLEDFRPIVIAIVLSLFFTPFYFIYQSAEMLVLKDSSPSLSAPPVKQGFDKKFLVHFWQEVKSLPFFRWVKNGIKAIGVHFKNPSFFTGFAIIFAILAASFLHTWFADPMIEQTGVQMDDEANLLGAPPYPPSDFAILGTDRLGFSIFDQLAVGAKYTILVPAVIALLRMLIGFLFAVPYALFIREKWQKGLEKLIDGFHYLPMFIIAYFLLRPILPVRAEVTYSVFEKIAIEVVILTLLVVPLITVLLGNEIKQLMKKEFVTGSRVLGGGSIHILFRHILPHMGARLALIFGQQFIQVLLLFIHLGVFFLYLGGTIIGPPAQSVTNEWSGLIGSSVYAFRQGHSWMIFSVLAAFMIVIFAMQLMIEGIKQEQQRKTGTARQTWFMRKKKRKDRESDESNREQDFSRVDSPNYYHKG